MILEAKMLYSRIVHRQPGSPRSVAISKALVDYLLKPRSNNALQDGPNRLDGDGVVGASDLTPVGDNGGIGVVDREGVLA